jgi:hypothetical protein
MVLDKSFGPYGFKQKLVICYPPGSVDRSHLEDNSPLTFIKTRDDGTMVFEWTTRSMKKGDDETLVYTIGLQIPDGWSVDWENSDY